MSLSDAYATKEEYKAVVEISGTTYDDAIESHLLMTSRWWDGTLNRRAGFNQLDDEDEPVTRRFYVHRGPSGCGSDMLFVEDIASSDGVTVAVNGEDLDEANYQLWPLNADKDSEPRPFDRIIKPGGWALDMPIDVTAPWGWPAVPPAIKAATIEWCAMWRGESARATGSVADLDQVAGASPYHLSQLKRLTGLYRQPRAPYVAPPRRT